MNEKVKFIMFVILGIAILIVGSILWKEAGKVKSRPTVTGKVVTSTVDYAHDSQSQQETTMYSAKVKYQYSINGITYFSEKISMGKFSTSSRNQAQKIADKYPPGKEVVVYYNPDNPDEAVLEPDETIYVLIVFILGALVLLAGVRGVMRQSSVA